MCMLMLNHRHILKLEHRSLMLRKKPVPDFETHFNFPQNRIRIEKKIFHKLLVLKT